LPVKMVKGFVPTWARRATGFSWREGAIKKKK
jgi:hypothetical protein